MHARVMLKEIEERSAPPLFEVCMEAFGSGATIMPLCGPDSPGNKPTNSKFGPRSSAAEGPLIAFTGPDLLLDLSLEGSPCRPRHHPCLVTAVGSGADAVPGLAAVTGPTSGRTGFARLRLVAATANVPASLAPVSPPPQAVALAPSSTLLSLAREAVLASPALGLLSPRVDAPNWIAPSSPSSRVGATTSPAPTSSTLWVLSCTTTEPPAAVLLKALPQEV